PLRGRMPRLRSAAGSEGSPLGSEGRAEREGAIVAKNTRRACLHSRALRRTQTRQRLPGLSVLKPAAQTSALAQCLEVRASAPLHTSDDRCKLRPEIRRARREQRVVLSAIHRQLQRIVPEFLAESSYTPRHELKESLAFDHDPNATLSAQRLSVPPEPIGDVHAGACPAAEPESFSNQSVRCPKSAERSEEHTSELQSREHLVCRLLLEKKNGALT